MCDKFIGKPSHLLNLQTYKNMFTTKRGAIYGWLFWKNENCIVRNKDLQIITTKFLSKKWGIEIKLVAYSIVRCIILNHKYGILQLTLPLLNYLIILWQSSLCSSGGIVFWADTVGPNQIYASLKKWSKLYGKFFEPSRFLEERATRGIPLVRALLSFLFF